jgi:predicted transcriptional regulator
MKEPNIQVTALMRKVCCKYNELNRKLKLLEEVGIITNEYQTQPTHPKVRIIHLMIDNPRTQTLLKVVKILSKAEEDYVAL